MLGLKLLWREWKAGDLGILLLATFLAVAIVTGLGLFTERLSGAINSQSNKLLGADLVLESSIPVDLSTLVLANEVQSSAATEFMSMLSSGDTFQLADIRAVDSAYPLKGELKVSDKVFGDAVSITNGPGKGEIWPDSRATQTLGLALGDSIDVGETQLTITRILVSAPGEGSNAMAPLALINSLDLAATAVVQEGSRVDHAYYFAGPIVEMGKLQQQLETNRLPGQRVYSVKEGQPRVARAIGRAEKYLLLSATLGIILAGAAIAIASRRYALEQESTVAVLKTLGLQSGGIAWLYTIQLMVIALLAICSGWLAGWGLERVIAEYIERALNLQLEATSLVPLYKGAMTGAFCLLVFAFPPLWKLRSVLPIKVLRREVGQSAPSVAQVAIIGILGLMLLVSFFTRDLAMTFALFSGLLLTTLLVGGAAWLILRSSHYAGMQAGSQWRLATSSLRRRALENSFQVVIFSTALLLFLVLLNMRTTLIDGWQAQIPEGTPNYFLINIGKEEVKPIDDWLAANAMQDEGLYPIVRARLTHINDQTLQERAAATRGDGERRGRRGGREINLTFANQMPTDNKLIEGDWWQAGNESLISIESGYAERLNVKIGDTMRFLNGGSNVTEASIANIREVDWEQMRPNFFIITTESVLQDLPAEYMTSFYAPDDKKPLISELMRNHPTTQLFEIDALIKQVRTIIEQVTMAIESVLWLTIACGALVLIATVRASQLERMQESAILRTLGASGKLIMNSLAIEFILIGLIAGVLASIGAEITSWLIQTRVFELENYKPSAIIWWLGPLSGAVLIGILGVFATRKVVRQSPVATLRELAN